MERELLLLGILRMQEMHGYQLNEIIEAHLGSSVHLKKATSYHLLSKMTEKGWISYREERQGNLPTRRIYSITAEGESAFQHLLRESLASYAPVDLRGSISLAFLDVLPSEEAAELLEKRKATVEDLLRRILSHPRHSGGFELILTYQTRHLRAELDWIDQVIGHLTHR
jgi:DNA-binding PadR family transcriptional regulator